MKDERNKSINRHMIKDNFIGLIELEYCLALV